MKVKLPNIFVVMHFTVQVLGHKPTANLCFLPTQALAKNILEYMEVPIDIVGYIYTKHLTILVRETMFYYN